MALVIYDVSQDDVYRSAERWLEEIISNETQAVVILLGNKVDLVPKERPGLQQMEDLAARFGMMHCEVKAKFKGFTML